MSAPQDHDGRPEVGHDLLAVLEALLFASAEPLTIEELRVALPESTTAEIEAGLAALAQALGASDRGLLLEKIAGGHRLATRPEFAPPLQLLFRFRNQKRLSAASLDVLAIIAYAQPITGPEIHEIRGADPAYALHSLLDRRLIRIIGRKRVVGRPLLYGTTRDFLLHFGLDSLEDLPPVAGFDTLVAPAQGRLFSVAETEIEPLPEAAGAPETPAGTVPGLSPAAAAPAERVAGPRLAGD